MANNTCYKWATIMSGKLRKNRLIRCPPVPHTNLHHHRLPSTVKLSVVPPSSSSVCQHIPAIPVEMRQVRNPSVDGCEILHQLVDGLSHDLQGFNTFQPSVWWCRQDFATIHSCTKSWSFALTGVHLKLLRNGFLGVWLPPKRSIHG